MKRGDGSITHRGEAGYALIFALGVMSILLVIGLRFLAVVQARQMTTNNEKQAIQAALLADAGVARAAYELSQSMKWKAGCTGVPLGGGTYSVAVTGTGTGSVEVMATGSFEGTTRARKAYVYTPAGSGTTILWGGYYGSGHIEWSEPEHLIDCADGENDLFAYHPMGESTRNEMSVGGFGSDIRAVAIKKVEVVISGYINQKIDKQSLLATWYWAGSGTIGPWCTWDKGKLDEHSGYDKRGRMYLDITNSPPPGGWQWRHFYHGTDLELRFMTQDAGSSSVVWMCLDSVGLRVEWKAE